MRIELEHRAIGNGEPCFVAAEIGINHNGDLELARQMIDAAAASGADAVKFQNYRTEDFILDRSLTYEYVSQGRTVVESQYDMFKRCELSPAMLADLCSYCRRRGIVFFSTPTSKSGISDLVQAGVTLLKNGSDFLVHLPLVRAMALTGLPTILSSGMATLAEVDDAVRAFRDAGGTQLVLLHCTSAYPTPPDDVHLRKLPALSAEFGVPVGLSDHTEGIVAAVGSVALGACVIEKHFTTDRLLPGPDQRFSSDPAEFSLLVKAVRTAERSLGTAEIGPTLSEMAGRRDFRLSCCAARDLPAGHQLQLEDITFLRPATGFPPRDADSLVGRKLRRRLAAGAVLKPEEFA